MPLLSNTPANTSSIIPLSRNTTIDILRFIAIALVLLHHFNIPYKLFDTFLTFYIANESFITLLARNGNYGVTLFFVISGYLITSHALQRWHCLSLIHYRAFYIARFARIIPTLILLVVLINFLGVYGLAPFMTQAPNGRVVSQAIVNLAALTFWMNILIIKAGWINYVLGVLWSLSVEEVFYLVFPLVAGRFKKPYFFILLCVGWIVFCPYFRALHFGEDSEAYLYHYFASFDGIAIGCLTALLAHQLNFNQLAVKFKSNIPFLTCTIIAIMLAIYFSAPIKQNCVWGVTLFSLCTGGLILLSLFPKKSNPTFKCSETNLYQRMARVLQHIGKNSYEIYLFHLVVLGFIKIYYTPAQTHGNIKVGLLLIYFIGSILAGYVIATYFSNPLNTKIRQKLIS